MPLMLSTKGPPAGTRETFWKTLQTFCVTRVAIAFIVLTYVAFSAMREVGGGGPAANWQGGILYLVASLLFALLSFYAQRRFMLQLLVQVALDIAAISFLYIVAGGVRSGLAILYLFPLAGCAILTPLIPALFFVSVVALILLGESAYEILHAISDASMSRAGLYGAALFAAIFLINRLAAKLIRQEALAAQRGRDLQMQEAINRLVIADMGDGILVVGRNTEVFAGNPAVERMLGLSVAYGQPRFNLEDLPSLAPITATYRQWQSGGGQAESGFVTIKPGDDIAALHGQGARRDFVAHLKIRFAKVDTEGLSDDRTVIFLQDVTEIENRAQQLKLASMGRLTASIAHEVRNPLSAISHAASLMKEDLQEKTQLRLLNIVSDNVVRLNRMIEDILKLSRKAHSQHEPLALAAFLAELLAEFNETHAVRPGLISVAATGDHRVRFDPLHLREVIINLLSNALRYASGQDGSIVVHAVTSQRNRLELHVRDDGPAIAPEVRAHLFEPFYTTSSKGTGLGLYVARELCLNNGAMLDYEYRVDGFADAGEPNGRFVITFAVLEPY
jgi:two-component system sensor histidine kinase PilS (NtrC family)